MNARIITAAHVFGLSYYCAFDIFLLLGAFHRRRQFANFYHNLMQNHLSQLPMQNKFYSSHWFLKNKIPYFYFFPTVKMYAHYAEICRVSNLEADFQRPACSIFLKFSQYCCETSIIQI